MNQVRGEDADWKISADDDVMMIGFFSRAGVTRATA
jgi:hypothetical protein